MLLAHVSIQDQSGMSREEGYQSWPTNSLSMIRKHSSRRPKRRALLRVRRRQENRERRPGLGEWIKCLSIRCPSRRRNVKSGYRSSSASSPVLTACYPYSIIYQAIQAEEQYEADLNAVETVSREGLARIAMIHLAYCIAATALHQSTQASAASSHQVAQGSRGSDLDLVRQYPRAEGCQHESTGVLHGEATRTRWNHQYHRRRLPDSGC